MSMNFQDCILAVSDDGVPGTEVVSTDLKSVDEGDSICMQCIQTEEKPKYWVKTIWGWVKSLYKHQQCKIVTEICQWGFSGLCGTLKMLTWL